MRWMGMAMLALAAPASAEVQSASDAGFTLEASVTVVATPVEAYAALTRPSLWWNASHSYSGKSDNLTLDPRAGGCFCERLGNGGTVEHMRVVYADPAEQLRLQGALGPLQAEAAMGTLTWTIGSAPGDSVVITQSYVVGGYVRGGAARLAAPVDAVMSEQLTRLKAHLDKS